METTLLGHNMPSVIKDLRKMLVKQGFIVQMMPTSNPVIVAYRKATWLKKQRQFVLEIISVDKNNTRVEITAIINNKKSIHAEGIIEENLATSICNFFKNAITPSYGFR